MLPGERFVGGLSCAQVLARLSQVLDGEVDASALEVVRAHVAGCEACDEFGQDFGALIAALRQLAHPDPVEADVSVRLTTWLAVRMRG